MTTIVESANRPAVFGIRSREDALPVVDPPVIPDPPDPDPLTDPLWAKVWYLVRLQETGGADDALDESIYAHGTRLIGVTINDAQKRYGGSSFKFTSSATDGCYIERSPTATWINDDWTMEAHVRFAAVTAFKTFFSQWDFVPTASRSFRWDHDASGGQMRLLLSFDGTNIDQTITAPWSPSPNTWYHVALVKSGSTVYFYAEGNLLGTGTVGGTIHPMTSGAHQSGIYLGSNGINTDDFGGWIDSARITVAARYAPASTYTVAEFPSDRDHSSLPIGAEVDPLFKYVDILMDFDAYSGIGTNDGVYNHAYKGVARKPGTTDTVANRPQFKSSASSPLDTGIKKWGVSSYNHPGGGFRDIIVEDRGIIAANVPFCMECWFYFNSADPSLDSPVHHVILGNWIEIAPNLRWYWFLTPTGNVFQYSTTGSDAINVSAAWPGGTKTTGQVWFHVAVTRDSSGVLRFYEDGSQIGTDQTGHGAAFAEPDDRLYVGDSNAGTNKDLRAHIDDLRVTIGHARYTGTSFTLPTSAYPRSRYANERPLVLL